MRVWKGLVGLLVVLVTISSMAGAANLEIRNADGAHIFISALYPDGFRHIADYDISSNDYKIVLNLADLKNAWQEEYRKNGTMAEPLISVTIVTKDGRIAVENVNFRWDKLPSSKVIYPKFKSVSPAKSNDVHVMVPEYYEWLDDSYEWSGNVILTKVQPDNTSWGTVDYSYFKNKNVGFKVYVFVDTDWTGKGYHIISKNDAGAHTGSFATGQNYYVWMKVKYRYERWGVYCAGDIYYKEYIYVIDFYPSTINGGTSKPEDAQTVPVDDYIYEGTKTSTSHDIPYYTFTLWNLDQKEVAIDCLKFIEVLKTLGKISSKAASAADAIGLFIGVNFEYDDTCGFYCSVRLYSNPNIAHPVYRAVTQAVDTTPAIYISN